MSVRSLFALASLTAIAAALAVAFIVLPEQVWSPTTICALVMFGFAISFALYSPFNLPNEGNGGDAAPIASLGGLSVIVTGLLGWSSLTFVVALSGHERISWAMMVISIAGFVISNLLLHASAKVVDQVASSTTGPSGITVWRAQIISLASSLTDSGQIIALNILADKIQFSASDISGAHRELSDQIQSAINLLSDEIMMKKGSSEDIVSLITEITRLIDRRDQELIVLRSKV